VEPVEDRLAVARVDLHVSRGRRVDRLYEAALAVLNLHTDVRSRHFAGVVERGVRGRHLQRRGLHVTLADREVDVVAL